MKFFFARFGAWLIFKLGIYSAWSRLYRFLFERRYRHIEISTYERYEDLAKVLKQLIWTADTWQQLWDAVSLPQKVEYIAKWSPTKRVGDCDEFAIYIVAALNKSLIAGVFIGDMELMSAGLLTVTWMDKNGHLGGHNVALLVKHREHSAGFAYMDYGMPSQGRNSSLEVVNDILAKYCPGGRCLAYAIHSEDLRQFGVACP